MATTPLFKRLWAWTQQAAPRLGLPAQGLDSATVIDTRPGKRPPADGDATPHDAPQNQPHNQPQPDGHDNDNTRFVVYDENLLEHARTQWQFGDWHSLTLIDRDTLANHPDRAALALLVASGHAQLGDTQETRQLVRLAQEWGSPPRLVRQILISGVYNSIGCAAAAAGQSNRAQQHFQSAVAIGSPSSVVPLISHARMQLQYEHLGLTPPSQGPTTATPDLSKLVMKFSLTDISAQIKAQAEELALARQQLDKTITQRLDNSTRQLEAFIGIDRYLATGHTQGKFHGWPISPDFGLYLIELIEANAYDLVIEFGSGTSTLLMAQALAKVRQRTGQACQQVAFEHLQKYHEQTHALLEHNQLHGSVQLEHTPLVPYTAPNGMAFEYYDCEAALQSLAWAHPQARILVVVDGPPAATGPLARYPALHHLWPQFEGAHLDFLMDDYIREDEKEIIRRWRDELLSHELDVRVTPLKFEKEAALLSVKTHRPV